MSSARPMLGDVELQQVQTIVVDGDQVLVQQAVPALEGDFLQGLGRRGTQVMLTGVLTGPEAAEGLKKLRAKFRAAELVSFVADITTATRVGQVLIEEMGVRELAGKPERFEYALMLREYTSPPAPEIEPPPPEPPPEPPFMDAGTFIIEVIVEGRPDFDLSKVTVTIEGTQQDGTTLFRTLTSRVNNVSTEESIPPGQYTAKAVASAPAAVTGSASGMVHAGQKTQVTITLRAAAVIARMFFVHFRFDKAFVEPCMRNVLQQVAQYANEHADEKLVIVGHTDKTGSGEYNQSLSERRARSIYAFLTCGRERDAAMAEWRALRQARPRGTECSINDTWGVREYQHMLQDLGFYPGPLDGDHGRRTNEAMAAYRCHKGFPPSTTVDDEVWEVLIEDYLTRSSFSVPQQSFLPNCPGDVLNWLGCGEEDPVNNTEAAHRPNRRVELLFVRADALPCEIPRPDTFDLTPADNGQPRQWCVSGGTATSGHGCFVSPHLNRNTRQPEPCSKAPSGPWCRQYAEPGSIKVRVSIQRELPDGSLQPVSRQQFVLVSPKGEFKKDEDPRGEAVPDSIREVSEDIRGTVEYGNMPVGWYQLEVRAPASQPVLVRLAEQSDEAIRGNSVCKHLGPDDSSLNVVIVNAPVLREIRLPATAHLMTALHPQTREVRLCTAGGANPEEQRTTLTDTQVRAAFDEANHILRQARIRFELTDIVREAYAYRTECEVDDVEFTTLLERDAYQDTTNVFFVGDLAETGEAGFGVSAESGAAAGLSGGCAVGDRYQSTVLGPSLSVPLSDRVRAQVLAHELAHYLNLDHVSDTTAHAGRLMLPGTATGDNCLLIADEVAQARSSQAARGTCVPLSLRVSGATQVGGSLSNHYITLQNPTGVVTVDAEIPDRLVAPEKGTLSMTDGTNTVAGRQLRVSTADKGEIKVVALYTPASGGEPIAKHVTILVVMFGLRVDGAIQSGPGSTTYVAAYDPTRVATVVALIDPAPFCVPTDLVTWSSGDPMPDPLRRTVAKRQTTTVTATLCGTSLGITIQITDETMILQPALGLPGLAEPGGNLRVLFLAREDTWARLGSVPWQYVPWQNPQQIIPVEVLEGPHEINPGGIQKLQEGWILTDHHLKLNRHVMELYEQNRFTHLMWVKLKAPTELGMYRLVNHFNEGEVLRQAIRGTEALADFADGHFPDSIQYIPDRGTTSVTTTGGRPSNIPVELYHPVFVTSKPYLDIAQVTDTHVSLTWELYDRRARERRVPLYNNFNRRFEDIMRECRDRADIILLTGDIVDYNRGHSHPWDNSNNLVNDYQFNRNWLLAYELILHSYSQTNAKPIFSLLGNHDYNLNAYAPSPRILGFALYESAHDFNLLERDLEHIDPGDPHALDMFGADSFTHATPASVLWYSLVINPCLDYAIFYKAMAFLCLDWGHGTSFRPPSDETPYLIDPDILPYPENCLSDQQWSLIQAWHAAIQDKRVKVLAFHATVYQPFPEIGYEDLSKGRIHDQQIIDDQPPPSYHPTRVHYTRWTHGELVYGAIVTAHHRNDLIDFLRGHLINLVLTGHSHRNTIFQIRGQGQDERVLKYRPVDFAKLELTKSLFVSTTSAGPLGYKNDSGVAAHLGGLGERRKVRPGFRVVRFNASGDITSLDTFETPAPEPRPDVQREYHG